jgi:hypothetical protein
LENNQEKNFQTSAFTQIVWFERSPLGLGLGYHLNRIHLNGGKPYLCKCLALAIKKKIKLKLLIQKRGLFAPCEFVMFCTIYYQVG